MDSKKYKYISIAKAPQPFNGKPIFEIVNNKSKKILGSLFYYSDWKQYVFTQASEGIIFNNECLSNIISFMNELKESKNG